MALVPRKFDGDKCPTCGTVFITDMHPFAVALREQERRKRSKNAKKGWRRRKRTENASLRGRTL